MSSQPPQPSPAPQGATELYRAIQPEPSTGRGPLPRPLLIVLGLAATVIAVAGLKAFGGTLGPAFLALVLVITIHPLQGWLQRRGVPAVLSSAALLVVVYAIVLALLASLALSVERLAALLPTYSNQLGSIVDQVLSWGRDLGIDQSQIRSALDPGQLVGLAQNLLGRVTGIGSDLLFLVVLLFFLGLDAAAFPRLLTAARRSRPQVVDALEAFAVGTRRYVVVSTIFGLIVAAADVVALYALGVPLPLLWGLLSFITNYVPNIGFVLGLLPPALLALLDGGPTDAVLVVVIYSVLNFVIQSLIQPRFVGGAVGLSVTLTFFSLVFWAFVLGSLGALLAIPASLLVKALVVDVDPALRWLQPLVTGVDDPEPTGGDSD